eukprot:gene6300-7464_t
MSRYASESVGALVDGVLAGKCLEDRLHCLRQLADTDIAPNLTEDHVEELSAILLGDEELYNGYSEVILLRPEIGIKVLDRLMAEPGLQRHAFILHRIYHTISLIGVKHDHFLKACSDRLLKVLQANDSSGYEDCFQAFKFLYGIQNQELGFPFTVEAKFREPARVPDNSAVQVIDKEILKQVKQSFLSKRLSPHRCGGYIDFLEACGLPVDPTDPAVQDVEINTWKGQYSTLPSEVLEEIGINPNIEESDEVRKLIHCERLRALEDHWQMLQGKHRASILSRALNKAIFIFALYFLLMWSYGSFPAQVFVAMSVSPTVKFCRWAFLVTGIAYGSSHHATLKKKEASLQQSKAAEEAKKQAAKAKASEAAGPDGIGLPAHMALVLNSHILTLFKSPLPRSTLSLINIVVALNGYSEGDKFFILGNEKRS